jgi:hypothetical protein
VPDETLSPETIRELEALDALLREERPRPDPEFARALDDRAARSFPRGLSGARAVPAPRGAAKLRSRLSGTLRSPAFRGLAATACALAIVAVVVATSGGGPDKASRGTGAAGVAAPADRQAENGSSAGRSPGAADSGSTPVTPSLAPPESGSPSTDSRSGRFVERTAALVLAARPADVDDVADGVIGVTDSVHGFVARSSVTSGHEATFELRIPSAQLPRALSDLSRLAHVRERTQATEDITSVVVSARDRLENARAERRSLLRRLARADTDARAAALRARLREVSRQIAAAKASLARAQNRARFATVEVEVVADRSAAGPGGGSGAWTPGDALHDAGRILELAAGVVLVAGAALLPVALVALLAWLAGRRAVRRRREAALDTL